MIDENEPRISVRRQCSLLDLRRTPFYYAERRTEDGKAKDKQAKQEILDWLLKDPCLGYRRLTIHVRNALQCRVNQKYVRRLMKELGLKEYFASAIPAKRIRNTKKYHTCLEA